jgi:2-octaprenyl-6-methoxyphenol hydroxylase
MNICILGDGLTALSLAKNLTKKKINVQIYETKRAINSSLNRTIGVTKKNLEFLNKEILALKEKDTWPITEIEIFSEKEKKDRILNFKKKDILFYMIKNDKYYYHLNNALKKDNFFRKKIITKKFSLDKMIKENKYDLIINCDSNNRITKKYFSKKITKDYFNRAYIATIIHEKLDNNKAVQIFTKCGPIAYLPLSKTETSVVCSLNLKNKSKYTNEEVLALINKNNPGFVLKKISDLKSFKLNLANLRNYSHENILAFGDLLHKIHPLAGQGFNMTLRDIKVLSDLIEERIDYGLPLDISIIEKFEKETKHKNFIFSNGIDLIYEIFNFNKDSNDSNFNNFLKRIGKNKIFTDAVMKVADGGFRSY